MEELKLLSEHYDVDALVNQLESVIESKDPVGYLQSNLNWEIDKDLDSSSEGDSLKTLTKSSAGLGYEAWNPLKKFINWLRRSKTAKMVKKILCQIADKIKKLIDEEAELKKILAVAIGAIIAAIGIGSINPAILTLVVGFLATMILEGVDNFCEI